MSANGLSMASRLAGGHATPQVQSTPPSVQRDRAWNSLPPRVRVVTKTGGQAYDRGSFVDVVVLVCLLALVGTVVLGALVMLLSWFGALSVRARIVCPEYDGCVMAGPDEAQAVLVDDHWTGEPMLTP
jgi:hypothetical protein